MNLSPADGQLAPQPAAEEIAADAVASASSSTGHDADAAPRGGVVSSSFWTVVGYGGSQVLRLATNIILGSLLLPEHFGLMLLVNTFLLGLEMFSDVGQGASLIQNARGEEPAFYNTAWTLQSARGGLLALFAALGAWPMAWLYNYEPLRVLIPVAGLTAAIAGFNSTALFTARRRLLLRELTFVELGAQTLGAAVMIVWGLASPSVWAFIAGALTTATAKMLGSHWLIAGVRNRFAWDPTAAAELIRFGKWVLLSTAITYCAMQGDRLVLGKLVDKSTLGIYGVAIAIASLPVFFIGNLSGSVLFPVLSHYAHGERREFERQLRVGRQVLLAVTAVLVLGVFAESRLFFTRLYGEPFHAAAVIARKMCLWAWVATLVASLEWALVALGDTRSLTLANCVRFVATTAATVVGFTWWGLDGFLGGLAVGALCGYLAMTAALARRGVQAWQGDLAFSLILAPAIGAVALLSFAVHRVFSDAGTAMWIDESLRIVVVAVAGVIALRQLLVIYRARQAGKASPMR